MPKIKTEIVTLKKLKKDGSIDPKVFNTISSALNNDAMVLLPLDCIYGIMCPLDCKHSKELIKLSNDKESGVVTLVSNFKMLESLVVIDKLQFDFLHRVWPGELIVYLRQKGLMNKKIPLRIPRTKFELDLITNIDRPLIFATLYDKNNNHIYNKNDIKKLFNNKVELIVLIDEFCKEHVVPTVVDICENRLDIITEGRIPIDEIKSLYFLGKDDSIE